MTALDGHPCRLGWPSGRTGPRRYCPDVVAPTVPPPHTLVQPRRRIDGRAAVLLPHTSAGEVDWGGFERLVEETTAAGLQPAVNMDTGFVNLLDPATRTEVLGRTQALLGGQPFVAGAFVADEPGCTFDRDAHLRAAEEVAVHGGTPVVFPSHGLTAGDGERWVANHHAIAEGCDRFVAFELSPAFAPFGRIYDLDAYESLLTIRQCVGAKHSSLSRAEEWARLVARDRIRPGFQVFTGNDLAIDMVVYGSDYLLGLAAFAPDRFAERDRRWAEGDPGFYELNDGLQALGDFAFRDPVPAYKHSCAQLLARRGWVAEPAVHPGSPTRPESDLPVLEGLGRRLGVLS